MFGIPQLLVPPAPAIYAHISDCSAGHLCPHIWLQLRPPSQQRPPARASRVTRALQPVMLLGIQQHLRQHQDVVGQLVHPFRAPVQIHLALDNRRRKPARPVSAFLTLHAGRLLYAVLALCILVRVQIFLQRAACRRALVLQQHEDRAIRTELEPDHCLWSARAAPARARGDLRHLGYERARSSVIAGQSCASGRS